LPIFITAGFSLGVGLDQHMLRYDVANDEKCCIYSAVSR
jgi:hypothetical protein